MKGASVEYISNVPRTVLSMSWVVRHVALTLALCGRWNFREDEGRERSSNCFRSQDVTSQCDLTWLPYHKGAPRPTTEDKEVLNDTWKSLIWVCLSSSLGFYFTSGPPLCEVPWGRGYEGGLNEFIYSSIRSELILLMRSLHFSRLWGKAVSTTASSMMAAPF